MKFAVNYSAAAVELARAGKIKTDYFKCPAWQDRLAEFQAAGAIYVHLPLIVGNGNGDAFNHETRRVADWRAIEAMLAQTQTPLVNLHLAPSAKDFPDLPTDSLKPAHVQVLLERAIRDVQTVVQRFGKESVIIENTDGTEEQLRAVVAPELIRGVVAATGCGFLLDVSHARLAAINLGMDVADYIAALPVAHTKEIHVTGLQMFAGEWIARAREFGTSEQTIALFRNRLIDHLPMTDADWEFWAWAMHELRAGKWGAPWIVAFEYGGVGALWEATTKRDVLLAQVPRLYASISQK